MSPKARILAALTLATFAFPCAAIARPPSPAYWLWQHTRAHKGELVAASCQHGEHGYGCLLTIQSMPPRFRECWFVSMIPHRHGWHVTSVVPVPYAQCPALPLVHHGSRGMRQ